MTEATKKIESHKRYMEAQSSVQPKGFADVIGQGLLSHFLIFSFFNLKKNCVEICVFWKLGNDLHIPKNISELTTFSGMPSEHAARF